jgi:hypothetical protein
VVLQRLQYSNVPFHWLPEPGSAPAPRVATSRQLHLPPLNMAYDDYDRNVSHVNGVA